MQECHIDSYVKNNKSWRDRGKQKADTLPGDCHATLAMTEYFVPNEIRSPHCDDRTPWRKPHSTPITLYEFW